jgi:hypothetical protein
MNKKEETTKAVPDLRTVIYHFSLAFTTCDCGKDLVLAQYVYGVYKYEGSCGSCNKNFILLNNKLTTKNHA